MMAKDHFDIVVIGHFSIDSIILPDRQGPFTILGGAVAYVSLVAQRMGASAAVISKVGGDFPEKYMSQLLSAGVDISGIVKAMSERTTSFELTYNEDLTARALRLRRQGSSIAPNDMPSSIKGKTVHVAPIDGEISYEVVEKLRGCCERLSIDPQGMTRQFDPSGNVVNNLQIDKRVLSLVDIYKSSLDEIQLLTGQSDLNKATTAVHKLGPATVIVTMGAKGSILSAQGEIYQVPACKSKRVVDPTGAGDVFIGAYLTESIRSKDKFWCACVGSAAASLVVEGVGTSFFGEKTEIYRRALGIYQKENMR